MTEYPMALMADATHEIKRTSVPALDNILGHAFGVLDRGFIRIIDYMGDDGAISQAARVSYGEGTKSINDDRGLIRYLMRHWHTTPFEMCEVKLHVKLPLFVARQWIRHRTANVNEYSARYSILDKEFYFPAPEQMMFQSTDNKQGRSGQLDFVNARVVRQILMDDADQAYRHYEEMITNPAENGYGLARELARMNLPTNIYTQWYWKVDLHNLFHFLRLRADAHAQWEIRQYADVMCKLVQMWVPHAYDAFHDYRLHAATFSCQEMEILKGYMGLFMRNGDDSVSSDLKKAGLSAREIAEFVKKMGGVE